MDKKVESKTVAYSRTVMSRIMLPSEANQQAMCMVARL